MMRYLLFLLLFIPHFLLDASYTLKNGKLMNSELVATLSVQELTIALFPLHALRQEQWEELVHQSLIMINNFPTTPFAEETYFYLGVGPSIQSGCRIRAWPITKLNALFEKAVQS